MKIVYIFRARNPRFFSIERVFDLITGSLPSKWSWSELTVPRIGFSFSNVVFLFGKVSRTNKQNIYHVTGDIHYCVFALPATRTVLTIHDCVFVNQYNGWRRWLVKKIFLDWPVKYLKYISTVSEKSKQEIVNLTQCHPGKIKVIPNPVSAEIYFQPKEFNGENPELLFIGATPNKNLERVAEAIKDISCRLTIIGKLSESQAQLLHSAAINFKVYTGLSDKEVADKYASADIILFPSLYEGFGLPVIEGFKAGRVVVTSNINPMKETAEDAACMVDPFSVDSIRESLLKVINNSLYRNILVEKGFERVKKFDAAVIALEYSAMYDNML